MTFYNKLQEAVDGKSSYIKVNDVCSICFSNVDKHRIYEIYFPNDDYTTGGTSYGPFDVDNVESIKANVIKCTTEYLNMVLSADVDNLASNGGWM